MSAPARAALTETDFRTTARRWTTGVAVVTTRSSEEVFAKTVSSFCTLSLDPLLVSVAVARRSPLVTAVRGSGRFAVSILTAHQIGVAHRFATPGQGRALGTFTAVPMRTERTGAPVIEEALAWFDCRLHALLPGGDHAILVGRAEAAGDGPGEPLLHHDGEYRLLTPTPLNPTGVGT